MLQFESGQEGGTAVSASLPALAPVEISLDGDRWVARSDPLLIVDDHPVVRDGVRGMFAGEEGFEVIGEAADGGEAVTKAAALRPDVVLMDLRMPGIDGVAAIRRLAEAELDMKVLVLTTYETDSDVLAAIEAGATGYLLKDAPRHDLLNAVRAAARGEAVLSPRVGALLLDQVRQPAQGYGERRASSRCCA